MTDNETNLAKWTAFARATDPEAVGHTLNELAGEIQRLRGVCRDAARPLERHIAEVLDLPFDRKTVLRIAKDLANEGSKDGK
jgi:hypothetical protein